MFEKKFKVRVVHFIKLYYKVYYSNSRFIDNWCQLQVWYGSDNFSHDYWNPLLKTFDEAERIAMTLKSMEDVDAFHKPYIDEHKKYLEDKKEYLSKNVPYEYKDIIN